MARTKPNRPEPLRGTRLEALEMAFEHLPLGVGVMATDGTPIAFNKRFRDIHHISEMPTERFDVHKLIEQGAFADWDVDPVEYFDHQRTAVSERGEFTTEMGIGDRIMAIHDVAIGGKYVVTTQEDITARVTAERRISHLALHDPLTELPNRAAFTAEMQTVLEETRARNESFAVLAVDLDHFKDVNDVFGHHTGDALLQAISARFRTAVGGQFLARLGGDEFTFICRGGPQPDAAARLAESIFSRATGEVSVDGKPIVVGLSMGVSVFPEDGDDVKTLLNNADAALYRSKSEGRGIVRFYEPQMDQKIHEQRLLLQDLRLAVDREELLLHYQPQARIDGTITGYEALVRWHLPRLGLVMPGTFIPIAESSGLIIDIGEWVLRRACREAAGWQEPLQIAVNLSPVQFRHGDLAALIHRVLIDTGLNPARLELEITESTLVDDFGRALSVLRRIKALGVKIAMDDFGIGYSSLSYLQAFPFDKLKIDRSFISRLQGGEHSREIIRAVIGLGRGLNLPIVAEGVETSEQLAFLAAENCYGVQGYLIGRPAPIAGTDDAEPDQPKTRRA